MRTVTLSLNGAKLQVEEDRPLIQAAREHEVYIPGLCFHPDLPAAEECGLCLVEVEGESDLVHACKTSTRQGLSVRTESDRIRAARQAKLAEILTHHPHACLTCAQQEGCSREPCSTNVPVAERCCPKLGHCEVQKVAAFIGIPPETKKWVPTSHPKFEAEPLLRRDYNLCIGCTRCVRACEDLRRIGALTTREIEPGVTIAWAKEETLVDSGCKFCGACVEVCPTGALMDRDLPPGRHALFTHGGVVRLLAREVGEDRFVPTGTLVVVDWDSRRLLSVREGEGTPRDEKGALAEERSA